MAVPRVAQGVTQAEIDLTLCFIKFLYPDTPLAEQQAAAAVIAAAAKMQANWLASQGVTTEQAINGLAAGADARDEGTLGRFHREMNAARARAVAGQVSDHPAAVAASIERVVREVISCGLPGCTNTTGLNLCSRCRNISYCSREHQKLHWQQEQGHKGNCKPS